MTEIHLPRAIHTGAPTGRRRRLFRLLVTVYAIACAGGSVDAAEPSAEEQYLLELLNRHRLNRTYDANALNGTFNAPYSSPLTPVVWSSGLSDAAAAHNVTMIAQDSASPTDEPTAQQRAATAGFGGTVHAENVVPQSTSVLEAHRTMATSYRQDPRDPFSGYSNAYHLNDDIVEVGIDVSSRTPATASLGPVVVTEVLGKRTASTPRYLSGVIYNDSPGGDYFYTPGEGVGGVTVEAIGGTTQRRFITTTNAAGGYQLALPTTENYGVTISGPGLDRVIRGAVWNSPEVKIDSINVYTAAGFYPNPPRNVPGDLVIYAPAGPTRKTISTPGFQHLGKLIIDNPAGYTFPNASFTFSSDQSTETPGIEVRSGHQVIEGWIQYPYSMGISVAAGARLTFRNDIASGQTATVEKAGAGTLTLAPGTLEPTNRYPRLRLVGGTTEFPGNSDTANLEVRSAGARAVYSLTATVRQLLVAEGGKVELSAGGNKALLISSGLDIDETSAIDLADNTLVRKGGRTVAGELERLQAMVRRASNLGEWDRGGITSSAARAKRHTALAVIPNRAADGTTLFKSIAGQALTAEDLLIDYTWNGDADLDGRVDPDDYALLDQGFESDGALTGWRYGDFNYDGRINADDYWLIDSAFLHQKGTLGVAPVVNTQVTAVPEPQLLAGMLLIPTLAGRSRRHRIHDRR